MVRKGKPTYIGRPGQSLLGDFMGACKASHGKPLWGDYYRGIKRKKDPPELIAKCEKLGYYLYSIS